MPRVEAVRKVVVFQVDYRQSVRRHHDQVFDWDYITRDDGIGEVQIPLDQIDIRWEHLSLHTV
jgi:hypothetical protein